MVCFAIWGFIDVYKRQHLHYVEGYSTDEAAALVGCRPSTARTRLHRARKHLKAALETADLAGRPVPCQPAGASRADDGSAFSRPASSAFASLRPADNRCASVHPATTDSPSSVSYTHLDVYKRQALFCVRISTRSPSCSS